MTSTRVRTIGVVFFAASLVAVEGVAGADPVPVGANGRIVFTGSDDDRGDSWLYSINPDGTGLVDFYNDFGDFNDAHGFVWSPTGKRLAFIYDGALWTASPSMGSARKIVEPSQVLGSIGRYVWLPDGSGLALEATHSTGLGDIYFVDPTGFDLRTPTDGEVAAGCLTADPGRDRLVFCVGETTYSMAANGGDRQLFPGAPPLDWSLDGSAYVFATGDETYSVFNVATGRSKPWPVSDAVSPNLSPDGTKIAFMRLDVFQDEFYLYDDLMVANRDGSGVKQLVRVPNAPGDLDWGACSIVGTRRDDVLEGTDGWDTICGLGGADTLFGLGGRDMIAGLAGGDVLHGGRGDDWLFGGSENDQLFGEGGQRDWLQGGPGTDACAPDVGSELVPCD